MIDALLIVLGVCLSAQEGIESDSGRSSEGVQPVTVVAIPSGETRATAAGWLEGRDWRLQHEDCVALAESPRHDLVLLGDSITQSFGGEGRRTWQPGRSILDRTFEGLRVGNMGISGDRTQHLLWRLENGALSGPAPEAYLVAIGTNNIGHDDPEAIAHGIEKIVRLIHARRPQSMILLCPILPRGFLREDPAREAARAVNEQIRALVALERVWWVECDKTFLEEDGTLRRSYFAPDGLHLAAPGYEAWGHAIGHTLELARATDTEGERLE